jgi:glutaredoxin-like protein NrdH
MAPVPDQITVYWIPGCANCTRLKGYLDDRGIDFEAVNLLNDVSAFEETQRIGLTTMPAVRRGDRWATGFDLDQVNELLGIDRDPSGRRLEIQEIAERAASLLDVAGSLATQVPPERHEDPTPTVAQPATAFLFYEDGNPYVPHGTVKSLVHHIAGHGEKLKRLAMAAEGRYELGFSMQLTGEAAAFGEPVESTPMYRVIAQMALTASDIRSWMRENPKPDLSGVIETHYGSQTFQELLQTMTCSLAQHARQLTWVVERLGLEPDRRIDEGVFEGLLMPSGVWQ